jgi:TRAP-type mannitol/chloroaromatic compound transport system permease small subunit
MKRITKTQTVTLIVIVAYFIWEYFVQQWIQTSKSTGALIRVDLVLILPILFVLILISLIQQIKKKKST